MTFSAGIIDGLLFGFELLIVEEFEERFFLINIGFLEIAIGF
jgi:hypothetical protein